MEYWSVGVLREVRIAPRGRGVRVLRASVLAASKPDISPAKPPNCRKNINFDTATAMVGSFPLHESRLRL